MSNKLNFLSTRKGFNTALRHFEATNEFSDDVSKGYNLASILNYELKEQDIHADQVQPIINALLVDKFEYAHLCLNLDRTIHNADKIHNTVQRWNNLQIVMIYKNLLNGTVLINPAEKKEIDDALPFVKGEFCAIFAGSTVVKQRDVWQRAVYDVKRLLAGQSVRDDTLYRGGTEKPRSVPAYYSDNHSDAPTPSVDTSAPDGGTAPDAQQAGTDGVWRITPKYSVLVTNELFHNGNVEAWKRIITSYNSSYPDNEVMIWYAGERILDINTLFKWGKIKNGTPIIFSVAGTQIGGISKLQRYLFEGASPRFETFLRGGPNQVLNLF